jgi:hypothetical protein
LAGSAVERLNGGCFCISLDPSALQHALEAEIGVPGMAELVQERCPYIFAARPVFVTDTHLAAMAKLIDAVESVVALPAYRAAILAEAPAIARVDPGGAKGVFFGYDFHVGAAGIGLLEVNTNAGGALLNAVLARAQSACCAPVARKLPMLGQPARFEADIVQMFQDEWRASRGERPLRRIAIVDRDPQQQYLYPEFVLFQQLFARADIDVVIADPAALVYRDGKLWHADAEIDLVYNRLTDFLLEDPSSAALRAAYVDHAVVLTPHPQAYVLYADKRNLALLTDAARLAALGVPADIQARLLTGIPATQRVDAANAERLWQERRRLFFKPAFGYGSRAAYRGDKLTKRVWQEILAGDYVAQANIAPGERTVDREEATPLKFDLRNYVYDRRVQWVAARLYQGQTTNFRTPGGGFAPVYGLADDADAACCSPAAVTP